MMKLAFFKIFSQKINQKNMWQLTLIDHLSEIIRAGPKDEGNETNFQKVTFFISSLFLIW